MSRPYIQRKKYYEDLFGRNTIGLPPVSLCRAYLFWPSCPRPGRPSDGTPNVPFPYSCRVGR